MDNNSDKNKQDHNVNLLPLSEAAKLSGYTPEHLNFLSRKGNLKSQKIGRNWYMTREALEEFLAKSGKAFDMPEDGHQPPGAVSANESVESDSGVFQPGDRQLSARTEKETIQAAKNNISQPDEKTSLAEDLPSVTSSAPKVLAGVFSLLIILPIVFFASSLSRYVFRDDNNAEIGNITDSLEENIIINENGKAGEVRGEEDVNGSEKGFVSENFKISQISFGGQGISLSAENNEQLAISDVKSESFISGKNGSAKMVVTWRTNKPALSVLEYSKNNGQNAKKILEDSYGYLHSAVVSELDPRTSYIYSIESRDRWGNAINSNFFGIYTASKPESVFDLIAGALGDVFGWAMKK